MTSRPEMDLSISPYLQGNYAPVLEEQSLDQGRGGLRVEGEIPSGLLGAFMRNGPNIAWQPKLLCLSVGWRWHGACCVFQRWASALSQSLGAHCGVSGRGETWTLLLWQCWENPHA